MTLTSDLNPAQTEAVLHRDGPAIVLAGPGAGKTKTLTKRAAALVQSGVMPEQILLLTFSRASAKEMLQRAKALDSRCEFISGGTFHATATKILNQNTHIFGLDKPFTVLDPEDATQIIKKVMEPVKDGDQRNWPRASTVAKVISFAANTQLSIADSIERKCPDYADFAEEIDRIRIAFMEYKIGRGMIDYDDILVYFAALLEDPNTGPHIRRRWSHVMVDEYQDTNALQLQIVYGLAGDAQNIMIVGDPSQSIYGFRGSAPSTMTAFRDRFPAAKVIALETNYRSSEEIVSVVNAIDGCMPAAFDRTLVSAKGECGTPPVIVELEDAVAEAAAIADFIIEHKANGGEVSDNAVLVRSMNMARRIEAEFITRRIPYRVVGGIRIDEAAHIKDLLCIARLACNLAHEPAWLRLLERYNRIGEKASTQITERLVKCHLASEAAVILDEEAKARKTEFTGLAAALTALSSFRPPAEILAEATAIMNDFWQSVWQEEWQDRRKDIDAILLIAEEHPSLDSFLTAVTLDHSLDKKNEQASEKQDEAPVTISTVHGAKGLEWPCCHVPNFNRGHMPSLFANCPEDYEEELRIFYVAASRAIRTLRFYRPMYDAKGNFTAPSDYERLILDYVDTEKYAPKKVVPIAGRIETAARIDMRSRLLKAG
jgi:DNA helicase-2/ATP-dependent DNA helicase PcrA